MLAVLHARMTQRPDLVWHPTATLSPTPEPTAPRQLVYIPEVAHQMTLQPNNPRMLAVLHARMTQRPDLVWHPTATTKPTSTPTPPTMSRATANFLLTHASTLRARMTQIALTPFVITVPGPTAAKQIGPIIKTLISPPVIDMLQRSWHLNDFQRKCYAQLQCGLVQDQSGCMVGRAWESCMVNVQMASVRTAEAAHEQDGQNADESFDNAATQRAQFCKNDALHPPNPSSAECVLYPTRTPRPVIPTYQWPTKTPKPRRGNGGAVPPPTVEPSLKTLAFQQCFPGGAGLSNSIRSGETLGSDTSHLKRDFRNRFGDPCGCTLSDGRGVPCVH